MTSLQLVLLSITSAMVSAAVGQQPVPVQKVVQQNGMPSAGGYQAPSTSLMRLLESDRAMNDALMTYARTGGKSAYRASVLKAAQEGDLAAELVLAEQYIPEQCTFEPNQDVPTAARRATNLHMWSSEPIHLIYKRPMKMPQSGWRRPVHKVLAKQAKSWLS